MEIMGLKQIMVDNKRFVRFLP